MAGPALAQVPVGGVFTVNTYTTNPQFYSAGAVGPDGGFEVVWSSFGQDDPHVGSFGQRFSPSGLKVGGEFQVNGYTTGFQGSPRIATLADGGFVVVYFNDRDVSVWARRYDGAGNPRGPEFQVGAPAPNAVGSLPHVAADPRGGFIVAWEGDDGSLRGVAARRYDRAGEPVGDEFRVNTITTGFQGRPSLAIDGAGAFTVTWSSGLGPESDIYARRFDASGQSLGGEFLVNSFGSFSQYGSRIAMDRQGDAIIVWSSRDQDGDGRGVYGQRYDRSGARLGAEFRVNASTLGSQQGPSVAADESGNFVVAWNQDAKSIMGSRFDVQGVARGGDFVIGPVTTADQAGAWAASDRHGNFVVSWTTYQGDIDVLAQRYGWIFPGQLRVDPAPSATSDGNHILEPCERVPVQTGWRNLSAGPQTLSGSASSFTGPPGATYLLRDAQAAYGAVAVGALGLCASGGDCYEVEVSCPAARPLTHWDALLSEDIAPVEQGQSAVWRVHLGDSFTDVPRASSFYPWVETLLHNGVTVGCSATEYCPGLPVTREQMAVFVVSGRAGPYYAPASCQGTPIFADVPVGSPYCRWIEELSRLGVISGCGGGNYCPGANVSRQEMAVFVLRTTEPGLNPPPCATPLFADVPASSPYCRWIEELVRRGVVTGCGGGNYCPADPVTRQQMAVFIVVTYGLGLYNP